MPQDFMVKPAEVCRRWADTDIPLSRCCLETSGMYGPKALEVTQDMRIAIRLWRSLVCFNVEATEFRTCGDHPVFLSWGEFQSSELLLVCTNHILVSGNDKRSTYSTHIATHILYSHRDGRAHTVSVAHTTCLYFQIISSVI
jgi:hypothetical protein